MTETAAVSVDVDPRNPGEFFACCGLLELADRLWAGGAQGWFSAAQFHLVRIIPRQTGTLVELLDELASLRPVDETAGNRAITDETSVEDEAPSEEVDAKEQDTQEFDEESEADESEETEGEDEIGEDDEADKPVKAKIPKIPPLLIRSTSGRVEIVLDWWMKYEIQRRKPVESATDLKTWAANATSRQMFLKWLPNNGKKDNPKLRRFWHDYLQMVKKEPTAALQLSDFRLQGSYGFDSRSGWDALEIGFSLNEHPGMKEVRVSPAVELLGAVGLQRFMPVIEGRRGIVAYTTWATPLPPAVARVASAGLLPTMILGKYRSQFTKRGSFWGLDYATDL